MSLDLVGCGQLQAQVYHALEISNLPVADPFATHADEEDGEHEGNTAKREYQFRTRDMLKAGLEIG